MQNFAVVYFLKTDLDKLDSLRKKYDPNWRIISPHMTIVFPLIDVSEDELSRLVKDVADNTKSFPLHLKGLTKSSDDYLFLLAKEGNEEIVKLHDKLYSGVLTPYLRKDIPFIPHITLGYFKTSDNVFNQELFEKAYIQADEMNIDINCNFNNIALIKGDGLTSPKIIQIFNLA